MRAKDSEREGCEGMAGTICPADGDRGRTLPASLLVATVVDLLAMHIQSGRRSDSAEFSDLCFALARGIDYAVANSQIPLRAQDLPLLLKQVLRRINDSSLEAVAMVLMISVKNACKSGWFLDHDATDLLSLAKEVGKSFSTMEDISAEPCHPLPNVSDVMSRLHPKLRGFFKLNDLSGRYVSALIMKSLMYRYYPQLKLGHVLASLDVKPGYGVFVVDFHITRSMVSPAQKNICLFVARTDDVDTSSCIVTPPQVNFLLNGKGVWGRINVSMDNGPQLPTNVSPMLKYGINLLQVVGQFNGHYVIMVAFMSVTSTSGTPELQEYILPVAATSDSDSEIIEEQARISLNCPISLKRIRIPVKGYHCKHHQCFDYGNFIEINSRRPSWRCPHCNQSICSTDLRIDRKMVKILKEVGEDVVDVIISPDGSWKNVVKSINRVNMPQNNCQENNDQSEPVMLSSNPANTVDLTTGVDDDDEPPDNFRTQDVKPLKDDLLGFSAGEKFVSANTVWASPVTSSNAPSSTGVSRSTFSFMPTPVLTDAVASSCRENQVPNLVPDNLHLNPSELRSWESRWRSQFTNNELGRLASTLRHSTKNQQAVPAQDQSPRLGDTRSTPTGSQTPFSMAPRVQLQQRSSSSQVSVPRSPPSVPVQLRPARTGTGISVGMVSGQLRTASEQRRSVMGIASPGPGPEASAALPADDNWRPSGRMRGSLTGEAYSAALSQFMLQPTQPARPPPPRPPLNLPSNVLPTVRLFPRTGSGNSNEHSAAPSQAEPRPSLPHSGVGS